MSLAPLVSRQHVFTQVAQVNSVGVRCVRCGEFRWTSPSYAAVCADARLAAVGDGSYAWVHDSACPGQTA
jgi:hypothetical protein